MKSHSFWKFTHFTWEGFMYRERWERDNEILKSELMMIAHNYDPAYGFRCLTRNSTHFGSQNSWYMYKRYIITTDTNEFNSLHSSPSQKPTEISAGLMFLRSKDI